MSFELRGSPWMNPPRPRGSRLDALFDLDSQTKGAKEKQTSTNKLETLFCWNKCIELLYYNCILQDCRLERQLLVEISIQYTLANISKSVFTTFVATNPLYWCAIVQTASFVRQSQSVISTFSTIRFLRLKQVFFSRCRLHSLCLQFKSFCPLMWVYNQDNSSVSGRSGCLLDSDEGQCFCVCEDSGASTRVEHFFFLFSFTRTSKPAATLSGSIKKNQTGGFNSTGYKALRHLSISSCGPVCTKTCCTSVEYHLWRVFTSV